ncbi:uncharacterized protein Tco025E_00081 [Trypanosoma conorhini]|uniref:Transmembrane protein n=1 Tax=Trypanosoma conorhini TaxID=83891 RepID=A0A3R7LMQ2_9TRYP|nr:uncharacterized protein Tco025E_00081 [Trypanosoma conorhini]RNF27697.1 hypothetical protein Tco025E_00081 [Trypanosoma conorhini]
MPKRTLDPDVPLGKSSLIAAIVSLFAGGGVCCFSYVYFAPLHAEGTQRTLCCPVGKEQDGGVRHRRCSGRTATRHPQHHRGEEIQANKQPHRHAHARSRTLRRQRQSHPTRRVCVREREGRGGKKRER